MLQELQRQSDKQFVSGCYVLPRSRGLLEATGEITTSVLPILLSLLVEELFSKCDGHYLIDSV